MLVNKLAVLLSKLIEGLFYLLYVISQDGGICQAFYATLHPNHAIFIIIYLTLLLLLNGFMLLLININKVVVWAGGDGCMQLLL